MALIRKVIWRKQENSVQGSVATCFAWPQGVTWNSSGTDEGGEILTEFDNPDWRQDIIRGRSATTPFLAEEIEIDYTPGYCESWRLCNQPAGLPIEGWAIQKITGYLNDGFSDVSTPSAPNALLNQTVDARARLKFIKRARSVQGSFRGATFLAELADTLRTIRNPARALRSSVDDYSAVARRRIHKAIGRDPRGVRARDLTNRQSRAAQRALSDSWLEAQFGWLPLIGDIGNGLDAYNKFADRLALDRVDAVEEEIGEPVTTFPTSNIADSYDCRTEVRTYERLVVHYYGAVKVNMNSFSSSLQEEAGFRVRDFLPALWEWIPYSFLVDYFTNIGDIVEAASFPRSNLAWCARTYVKWNVRDGSRMTVTRSTPTAYPLTNHTKVVAFFPSSIIIRRKLVSRASFEGSFVPSFEVEIPGLKNFKKYLNVAALVHLRGMKR